MKITLVATLIALVLCLAASFGYVLYDHHHISSNVRAALTASLDVNNSDADLAVYLRAAKFASHTKRDSEVIALLEDAIEQGRFARDAEQSAYRQTMVDIDCMVFHKKTFRCDPAQMKSDDLLAERNTVIGKDERAEARRLIALLRKNLDLPPIE